MKQQPYSVSLSFGPHIVHGQEQPSAFNEVFQRTLLNKLQEGVSSMVEDNLDLKATAPSLSFETVDSSSILETIRQWHKLIHEPKPAPFEPCFIPDWMRPSLHDKGMTDDQIDKILITGIEPNRDNGVPGIVFTTVTV